jgi:ketosteroid isomerase-like protein
MKLAGAAPVGASELPHAVFARALSRGDLRGALSCFARDGCLVNQDLTAIHGRERIRPVLAQLVAARTEIRVESGGAIAAGDALLARERWTIGVGPAGGRIERVCEPTLVMRVVEGRWKLVIAAPWGWSLGAG